MRAHREAQGRPEDVTLVGEWQRIKQARQWASNSLVGHRLGLLALEGVIDRALYEAGDQYARLRADARRISGYAPESSYAATLESSPRGHDHTADLTTSQERTLRRYRAATDALRSVGTDIERDTVATLMRDEWLDNAAYRQRVKVGLSTLARHLGLVQLDKRGRAV
jgi:hypothetical protein